MHDEWIDQLEDDWPKVWSVIQGSRDGWGDDMGAFLCFMAVRMLEMRRVLRSDGSMYLHCDPTASHYLKGLLDAIFGHKNFRNEIVWHYGKWSNAAGYWQRNHDIILFYSKTDNYAFHKQFALSEDKRRKLENGYQVNRPSGVKQLIVYDRKKAATKIAGGDYDKVIYRDKNNPGSPMHDTWHDINILNSQSKERTAYPTQKPLTLYERIIKASSNPGDVVLDPFCGCATTCVAAERLGRQWVGMDIWAGAYGVTIDRLKKEGYLAGPDDNRPDLLATEGHITYATELPRRTDTGEYAVPYLKPIKRVNREPPGPKHSNARMKEMLLDEYGMVCRGCDREFDDPRYLQLDHNTPRADGGLNHISNRILLCGPCNLLKSHTLTLSGLRRENKKQGFLQRPAGKTRPKPRQRRLLGYE